MSPEKKQNVSNEAVSALRDNSQGVRRIPEKLKLLQNAIARSARTGSNKSEISIPNK